MIENQPRQLIPSQLEDATGAANDFMQASRSSALDGSFAGEQLSRTVLSVADHAGQLLRAVPHPKSPGSYLPLSKHNAASFDAVRATLPGYMVLVPSKLKGLPETAEAPMLFPAVISEQQTTVDAVRLHVLRKAYVPKSSGVEFVTSMLLSAAGQSETAGVGEHGSGGTTNAASNGVEAEHFATLLAVGADRRLQTQWQAGSHVNHAWRGANQGRTTSVTAEVSKRLFTGELAAQSTIEVSRQEIALGKAALFWHGSMVDQASGTPEAATRPNALLVYQGLGFDALTRRTPTGLDTLKRLLA